MHPNPPLYEKLFFPKRFIKFLPVFPLNLFILIYVDIFSSAITYFYLSEPILICQNLVLYVKIFSNIFFEFLYTSVYRHLKQRFYHQNICSNFMFFTLNSFHFVSFYFLFKQNFLVFVKLNAMITLFALLDSLLFSERIEYIFDFNPTNLLIGVLLY